MPVWLVRMAADTISEISEMYQMRYLRYNSGWPEWFRASTSAQAIAVDLEGTETWGLAILQGFR